MTTSEQEDHLAGGRTVQRYAMLVQQRRYQIEVGAHGLEALLEPYAVDSSALTVPPQREPEPAD